MLLHSQKNICVGVSVLIKIASELYKIYLLKVYELQVFLFDLIKKNKNYNLFVSTWYNFKEKYFHNIINLISPFTVFKDRQTIEDCEKVFVFRVFLVRIFLDLNWIRSKSPYSVRMRENMDHKNFKYEHFLRSARMCFWLALFRFDFDLNF